MNKVVEKLSLLTRPDPAPTEGEAVLLATLQAPRRNGALVRVYGNGRLAYRFPPNPKWIPSRITVYSGVQHSRLGSGENLTPEQFVERYLALGYTRVEA